MKASAPLLALAFALAASGAEPSESAEKKPEGPAAPAAPAAPAVEASAQGAATPTPAAGTETPAPPAPAKTEDPTMLPQIEVNKSRIRDIDIQIAEKQRAIDREKQKTKPTRLDDALNNDKVSKALSIFGGSSSESRSGLAQERVRLLEEEKEILEAIKTAQSKEEKDELKQELELVKQMRRELDQGQK